MIAVPPPPATAIWRTSRASGPNAACVQVAGTRDYTWLRDSKHPGGPVLGLSRLGWLVFLGCAQRDGFCPGTTTHRITGAPQGTASPPSTPPAARATTPRR